jgi:hypothetical protein
MKNQTNKHWFELFLYMFTSCTHGLKTSMNSNIWGKGSIIQTNRGGKITIFKLN